MTRKTLFDSSRRGSPTTGRARGAGLTIIELLLAVAVLSVIALLGFRPLKCELDKGRMVSQISDLQKARDAIEIYRAELGQFPAYLADAFPKGNTPQHLVYCVDDEDRNNGHGNEFCTFFDPGNPSGNNPPQSAPGAGYILSTQRDLCHCKEVDFVWVTCCGQEPQLVASGGNNDPPGHPGGGGKGGGGRGGGGRGGGAGS